MDTTIENIRNRLQKRKLNNQIRIIENNKTLKTINIENDNFPSLLKENKNQINNWKDITIKKSENIEDKKNKLIKEIKINPIEKLKNHLNELYFQYNNEIYELINNNIYTTHDWYDIEPDNMDYLKYINNY
jgi:hypothetical protein